MPTPQRCWATWRTACRVRGDAVALLAGWLCCRAGDEHAPAAAAAPRLPARPLLPPIPTEATCKKVLLNAFTRALRDGFPPARVAGLKAIIATAKYHSPEDAATRVLPTVAPLCVDAVHEVRASALACVQHFTKVLVEHNAVLEKQAAAMQAAGEGAAAGPGAAAPGASGGGSLLNSFGWAVSNLGLGRGGADAAAGKLPAAAAGPGQGGPAAVAPVARAPAAPGRGLGSAPAATPAPAAAAAAGSGAVGAAPTSSGWENDDDAWEEMDSGDAGERSLVVWGWCAVRYVWTCRRAVTLPSCPAHPAEREARQRLSKLGMGGSRAAPAARARPAAPTPTRAPAAPAAPAAAQKSGGGEGWGDDDDDEGWADMDAPPVSPPKPTISPRRPAGGAASPAAAPRRPVGARPTGGGAAAAPLRKTTSGSGSGGHAMKLGVSKLGAAKLKAEENFEW